MKTTVSMLLMALLLNACATVQKVQKVDTQIPCIASIGKKKKTLFVKEFHKIGESNIISPIAASLKSIPFDKNSYTVYKNYRQELDEKPLVNFADFIKDHPRYYTLKITDFISLKSQLNAIENKDLKEYLISDAGNKVLTQISFVANAREIEILETAERFFIIKHDGVLAIETHGLLGKSIIKMKSLQSFDFETAGFCWKNDTYGSPMISVITTNGDICPKATERNPEKINNTKTYLKF